MKRLTIKYSCLLLIFGCLFSSCVGDLDLGDESMKEPDVSQQLVLDTVFSNAVDAQKVLTGAYSCLWYGLPWYWNERAQKMNMGIMESLGDNYQSYLDWDNLNRAYYTGKMSAGEEGAHSKYWYGNASTNDPTKAEAQWVGIRRAYLFIENVDRAPDMTPEMKKRLKGEAKMVIACLHADMFRHFGGLCCVRKAHDPNEGFNVPRSSVKETLKFITDLCDSAYVDLPWALPVSEVATWDGRFTGAAALGLKIRVLLFAASPLFNSDEPFYTKETVESVQENHVWTGGYDPAMWQDVVNACDLFFREQAANGTPVLSSDFRTAYFRRAGNGGESLISTRVRSDCGNWNQWDYQVFVNFGYGIANPTLEYANMFPMADGTPFDESVWDNTDIVPYKDPFAGRDPRLYETLVVNGMSYNGRTAECYLGGRDRGTGETAYLDGDNTDPNGNGTMNFCSGMGDFKFNLGATSSGGTRGLQNGLHWPYLRLAEIYLSYAEALNQVGRTPEAFKYIDDVRARVGLKGLQASNPGKTWTREAFLEEVLRERACEFGLEEVRFFDLIRWKREGDFRKRLHGLLIRQKRNANGVPTGEFSYEKVALKKRFLQDTDEGRVNFDSKWYLSAFPIDEVRKGYGLTQNPGW
ncbi:RagB/SusD family nutrient uptake outer membrane protein [Viscerimonas tarda]